MRARALLALAVLCAALPGRAMGDSSPNFVLAWGGFGTGNGQFMEPRGIAVEPSGTIAVVDQSNGIQRFTASGVFVQKLVSSSASFNNPRDLAVGPTGDLYATFNTLTAHAVNQYSSAGVLIRTMGSSGIGPGQFKDPIGIGIDELGNVFVCDYTNRNVSVFDASGNYVTRWSIQNPGSDSPVDVAARGGVVYVLIDTDGHVESYSNAGAFLGQFSAQAPGESGPSGYGITMDGAGDIYVGDDLKRWVKKFSPAGVLLTHWNGDDQSGGSLQEPGRLAVDPSGTIYVDDASRYQVLKFGSAPTAAPGMTLGRIKALYR
jgi:DNA-binding beta-propeller fold protein YncE